jgi:hypothetical protein
MKRYLVFLGEDYYPGGGWSDFKGSYEDLESARKKILTELDRTINQSNIKYKDLPVEDRFHSDWGQVVDLEKENIIEEYSIGSKEKFGSEKIIKKMNRTNKKNSKKKRKNNKKNRKSSTKKRKSSKKKSNKK